MKQQMYRLGVGCLVLVSSVACETLELRGLTDPPPSREGRVDTERHTARLTKGVALAVECWDSCIEPTAQCSGAKIEVSDEEVLSVHRAFLSENVGSLHADSNRLVFVFAGLEAGEADVTVTTDCTEETYKVTVSE